MRKNNAIINLIKGVASILNIFRPTVISISSGFKNDYTALKSDWHNIGADFKITR